MSILYTLSLGFSDRLRGSGWFKYSHTIGLLLMGVIIALMLKVSLWPLVYTVAAVTLGGSVGWGNPLGAAYDGREMGTDYEWWQVGVLRNSTLASVAFRGLMWGILLTPVSLIASGAIFLSFIIAPYLARATRMSWGWMEFTRGLLMGLMITIGMA